MLLVAVPSYTGMLVVRVDAPARAGLGIDTTRARAEQVRAYVAGTPGAALPETLDDGRPAFDEKAVSHLDDVRTVLSGARVATAVAALAALLWIAGTLVTRKNRALAFSLTAAAWAVAAVVVAAALAALLDFARFFEAFHALFFEAGTWQFAGDALLIRLFPEPFWAISGAVWGVLALAGAAILGASSRLVRSRLVRQEA